MLTKKTKQGILVAVHCSIVMSRTVNYNLVRPVRVDQLLQSPKKNKKFEENNRSTYILQLQCRIAIEFMISS
jgi:hypothetical protein